jgi:hypothetical protein
MVPLIMVAMVLLVMGIKAGIRPAKKLNRKIKPKNGSRI